MTRLLGLSVRRSLMSLVYLALILPMKSSVQSGTGMACKYQRFLYLLKEKTMFLEQTEIFPPFYFS